MNEINLIERMARIVNYDRYYKPTIDEFVSGFEYEYVLYSIRNYYEKGKPEYCATNHWNYGKVDSPWGCLRLEEIKKMLEKDQIRVKKEMKTNELRDLLKEYALSFNFLGFDVVVFPKESYENSLGGKGYYEHDVYVNGRHQRLIHFKDKLYSEWFSNEKANSDIGKDWRELLSLNGYGCPSTTINILYKYFEGIYKGTREELDKSNPLNEKQRIKKEERISPKRIPRKRKKRERKLGKDNLEIFKQHKLDVSRTLFQGKKHDPKDDRFVSDYVLKQRELKKEKIKIRFLEEVKKLNQKQKKSEIIKKAQEKNHKQMELQSMICIQSKLTAKVFRVPKHKAEKYVKKWFVYVPKYMWKTQLRKEREERKSISLNKLEEKKIEVPVYETKRTFNKIKHKYRGLKDSDPDYFKEETVIKITEEKAGTKIVTFLYNKLFKGENRKSRRQILQKKKFNDRHAKIQVIPTEWFTYTFKRKNSKKEVVDVTIKRPISYKSIVQFLYPPLIQQKVEKLKKQFEEYKEKLKKDKEQAALKKALEEQTKEKQEKKIKKKDKHIL